MSDPPPDHPTGEGPTSDLPTTLGPCRLLGPIGAGATGTVYRARLEHDRGYGARGDEVAVKVLHAERSGSPVAVRRFLREGELGRQIRHPGVVRVHEVGRTESDGTPYCYLVMERVEGRTLRDVMADLDCVPEALLRHLAAAIARALAAIHEAGLVHRDVKPTNIMITPQHQVRLMDLGLVVDPGSADRLTFEGAFVGTAAYAAPEQRAGIEIGPAADLHALGVVLYEAACGTLPFLRAERHARRGAPRRPSGIKPALSPFLDELILALLAERPEDRLGGADAVAAILEQGEACDWWRARERNLRAADPRRQLRRPEVDRAVAFVARTAELGELERRFDRAASGEGGVTVVRGEAGIGKSRLLDQLVARLRGRGERQPIVLYGRNDPGNDGGAEGALARALVEHLGRDELAGRVTELLAGAPDLVPAFTAHLTGTVAPAGAEPLTRESLRAVWVLVAQGLAELGPVLWIIEDVHFATGDERRLVGSLARAARARPLWLVVTSRPFPEDDELTTLTRLEGASALDLSRFGAREVIEFLTAALESSRLAERLGGRLAHLTDGNAFFLVEVLRELRHRGVVRRGEDGALTLTGSTRDLEVPPAIREVVAARLRGLGDAERALVDAGAVIGYSFSAELVAAALERSRLEVLQSLAAITRRTAILCATTTGFAFDHHQLQEVVLAELAPALAAEYHGRVARAHAAALGLDDLADPRLVGEAAVFVAEHLLCAGSRDGLAVVGRALAHLEEQYQHEVLVRLAARAIDLLGPDDDRRRVELRLRQANALNLLGRVDDGRDALDDAVACAERIGDERAAIEARIARARHHTNRGELARAEEESAIACDRAEALDDDGLAASAHVHLGAILTARGANDRARGELERGLELARLAEDRGLEQRALSALAATLYHLGELELSHRRGLEALALAEALGSRSAVVSTLSNVVSPLTMRGEWGAAIAHIERQGREARAIGDRLYELLATVNLGDLQWSCGRLGRAREQLEVARQLARETDYRIFDGVILANLGGIATELGRFDSAAGILAEAVEVSRASEHRRHEGWACYRLGLLAHARGDLDGAEEGLLRALGLQQGAALHADVAETSLALGRLRLARGALAAAGAALEEADRLAGDLGLAHLQPLPAAYLALAGSRAPGEVVVDGRATVLHAAEAHLVLDRAGAGGDHRRRARQLLAEVVEDLEPDDRESFLRHNPLAVVLATDR